MELNEAPVLDQLREHWQKMFALLLWKTTKGKPVTISAKDIESYVKQENTVIFTHGHADSVTFSLVSPARAAELEKFQRSQENKDVH